MSPVRTVAAALTAAALSALAVLPAGPASAQPQKGGLTFGASPAVERGRYLVAIMGCSDCHTPLKMGAKGPEPDQKLFLSGHPEKMKMPPAPSATGPWLWSGAATNTAFAGPWGVTYAPNLTSDEATGIGAWTEENFLKALRTGRHLGVGRPIQPPMPWPAFSRATDEDLRAVFAYLKTVPAVRNLAPEYRPPQVARR